MNNITSLDDGEKQESLIKIIRDDSIGSYSWDSSPKSINNGYGINEWSQADLMKLLNPKELYLDEPIIGKSLFWNKEKGKCYSSAQEINKDCDFNNNGISASAKVKLAKVRWNTGTFTSYDLSEWSAKNTYVAERSNNDGKKQCFGTNNETCNDDTLRTTTWDGYLALMYPSDYGYAVGGDVRTDCLAKSMYEYSGNNCFRNDWLILNNVAWTLTPVSHSSLATCAFYISKDGYIGHGHADIDYAVRPAGYLKSTIKIVENSNDNYGSKGNPFIIY